MPSFSRTVYRMHRFFILRHGETDANASGVIQGSSDFSRLTDKGRSQAAACGAAVFAKDPANKAHAPMIRHVDEIYVSPLTRARDTLSILRQHALRDVLPAQDDDIVWNELREIDLYEWEGQKASDLKVSEKRNYHAWKVGDAQSFVVSGRRPIVETWRRASSVWKTLRQHGGPVSVETNNDGIDARGGARRHQERQLSTLLVCHGTLGQALLCTAFGWDETHFRRHEFPNCGLVEIVWKEGNTVATSWKWHFPERTERLHPLVDTTLA